MLVQLILLVFFHSIVADPIPKPSYDVSDYEITGRFFEKFINEHKKQYDEHEKAMRFQIFIETLKDINRLNKEHPLTLFDITKFSDMSKEEGKALFGFRPVEDSNNTGDCKVLDEPSSKDAPSAWDWRDKGVVSPVKNQKDCGACWAFSTTALLESRNLQAGKKIILSEQQLLDCDELSYSCGGGLQTTALTKVMQQGGLESEDDYPYEMRDDTCRFDASKIVAKVSNCSAYRISNEDSLKELLYKEGPLSIALTTSMDWFNYKDGVYPHCDKGPLGHGALLVGYGSENGQDFWLIKNSYGENFGKQGYIKIKRGQNCSNIGSSCQCFDHRCISESMCSDNA